MSDETLRLEIRIAKLEGAVAALMTHVPEHARKLEELEDIVFGHIKEDDDE